jgi:molecular chaperone HtpG
MQRLLRRAGRGSAGKPVLEINPRHPLIRALAAAPESEVPESAGTLLDLARIQDGDSPRDPAAFARIVAVALAAART